jgi:hypothetical protein
MRICHQTFLTTIFAVLYTRAEKHSAPVRYIYSRQTVEIPQCICISSEPLGHHHCPTCTFVMAGRENMGFVIHLDRLRCLSATYGFGARLLDHARHPFCWAEPLKRPLTRVAYPASPCMCRRLRLEPGLVVCLIIVGFRYRASLLQLLISTSWLSSSDPPLFRLNT